MPTTSTTTDPVSATRARHAWVPYVAVISGSILLLKAALIIGSNNQLGDGPLTPPLYLAGVLLGLAAAVGAGLRARRGRRALVAVGLSAAFVLFIIAGISGPLFGAMSDAEWVEDEGPIGLLGLIVLLLGARARATD